MSTAEFLPAALGPSAVAGEVGVLGRFRIQKQIGRGGMGVVFQAIDTRLGRPVALKMMRPEIVATERARQRFLLEARAAAQVVHDNVVNILDIDEVDGVPFISMPFLKGRSLDEFLRKSPRPSVPQVLRIAREMAYGLEAAHELGVIHRDIKPANVWLEAPKGRVKILDFGLAKLLHDDSDGQLTSTGAFLGTPLYVAPEQAQTGPIDHRADLYSLGSVLYRMLSGKAPFERPGGLLTVLSALAIEQPKPIREINPDVSEGLAVLIHRLLEKDPVRRPRSAREVAELLRQLMLARPSGENPIGLLVTNDPAPAANDTTEREANPKRTVRNKPRSKTRPVKSEIDVELVDDVEFHARRGFVKKHILTLLGLIVFAFAMLGMGEFDHTVHGKLSIPQILLCAVPPALACRFLLRRDRSLKSSIAGRFWGTWIFGTLISVAIGAVGGKINDLGSHWNYRESGLELGAVFSGFFGAILCLFAAVIEWWFHRIRRRAAILNANEFD